MKGYFFNAQPTTDLEKYPSGFDRDYDAEDFNRFMGTFFDNGVFVKDDGNACKVTAAGLKLTVTPGIVLVDGSQCHFETGDSLTLGGAGLYSIMCRRNSAAGVRAFELVAVKGASSYPNPVREGDLYDMCLARVNATASAATVTDTRNDGAVCGYAALTGQPPYYPPDDANLPYILWLYVLGFPMTAAQKAAVEGNPSLMAIYNSAKARAATTAEAQGGTDSQHWITPSQVKTVIDGQKATQAQAEAGADNTKLMTPLRAKQAIQALGLLVKDQNSEPYSVISLPECPQNTGTPVIQNSSTSYYNIQQRCETTNYFWIAAKGSLTANTVHRISKATGEVTVIPNPSGLTVDLISPLSGDMLFATMYTGSTYSVYKLSGTTYSLFGNLPNATKLLFAIDSNRLLFTTEDQARYVKAMVGGVICAGEIQRGVPVGSAPIPTLYANGNYVYMPGSDEKPIGSGGQRDKVIFRLSIPTSSSGTLTATVISFGKGGQYGYTCGWVVEWPYAYGAITSVDQYSQSRGITAFFVVNLSAMTIVSKVEMGNYGKVEQCFKQGNQLFVYCTLGYPAPDSNMLRFQVSTLSITFIGYGGGMNESNSDSYGSCLLEPGYGAPLRLVPYKSGVIAQGRYYVWDGSYWKQTLDFRPSSYQYTYGLLDTGEWLYCANASPQPIYRKDVSIRAISAIKLEEG